MKTLNIFFCLILFATISKAQFAPINATWHIGLPVSNGIGVESFVKYVNTKDTVINGDTYSKIVGFNHSDSILTSNSFLLSKDQNVVYYFMEGKRNKLFDLGVKVGDSVVLDLYMAFTKSIVTSSVKIIRINWVNNNSILADSLKMYEFEVITPTTTNPFGVYTDRIIYSGNSANSFFIQLLKIPMIPEGIPYVRCYEDSGYQYKFKYFTKPCNSYNVGLVKIENNLGVVILPNPSKGSFHIQFGDQRAKEIRIYDLLGSLVYATSSSELNTKIEIPHAKKGIYSIAISTANTITNSKVVVE